MKTVFSRGEIIKDIETAVRFASDQELAEMHRGFYSDMEVETEGTSGLFLAYIVGKEEDEKDED